VTGPWIAAFVGLWVVVLLVALLQLGLVRRAGSLLEQVELQLSSIQVAASIQGLAAGSRVPDVDLRDASGHRRRLREWDDEAAVFLLLSDECEPCQTLLADLRDRSGNILGHHIVAIFDEYSAGLHPVLPPGMVVLYQSDESASQAFRTSATPHAFVTDGKGTIVASGIPNSSSDLARLADEGWKGGAGASASDGVKLGAHA
jgi:hypothetical protein